MFFAFVFSKLREQIDMEAISREVPKSLEMNASPETEVLVTHKTLQLFRYLLNEVVGKGINQWFWVKSTALIRESTV